MPVDLFEIYYQQFSIYLTNEWNVKKWFYEAIMYTCNNSFWTNPQQL